MGGQGDKEDNPCFGRNKHLGGGGVLCDGGITAHVYSLNYHSYSCPASWMRNVLTVRFFYVYDAETSRAVIY